MKKIIIGITVMAGLLLLASCKPDNGAGPIIITESEFTPTPIVVPTCTPTASPTPDPAMLPTAAPTEEAQPNKGATPTPEEVATEAPTATPAAEPTPEPTETPVPEPTATSVPEPTATPLPTATPTPSPSPSPTPVVDPESLVKNGWQKTVSIDEAYHIIFPDLFRESTVSKTGSELKVTYTCAENSAIKFSVIYSLQQTLEEKVKELPAAEGSILEGTLAEKRIVCRWQEEGKIYYGILLEGQYPQSLVGSAFGEAEWITGVMQVVFSYPADRNDEFETAEYSYYVIENREE